MRLIIFDRLIIFSIAKQTPDFVFKAMFIQSEHDSDCDAL